MTVRARASDPEGDTLRFRWSLAADGGRLVRVRAREVRWRLSEGLGPKVLRLHVADVQGAAAAAELRLSGDTVVTFGGRVVTTDGGPVDSARVEVNGATAWTDDGGEFTLRVPDTEAPRFVLNVDKPGFGLISRVYDHAVDDGGWVLPRGTMVSVDPTRPILVQDVAMGGSCGGTLSSRIDWSQYPRQRVARIFDLDGTPFSGPIPEPVRQAIAELSSVNPCASGISIGIPANSLVDGQGEAPSGLVEVSVSTVDLRSPDAMPGDYTARTEDSVTVMQSYGAGTVTVTADGEPLQLAEGARARLTIPVDPIRFDREVPPEASIPLLTYGKSDGVWRIEGEARLDAARRAYVAELTHFSAFNADILKADQSCVRIESGAITGDYLLEATLPTAAGPDVRSYAIDNAPETIHTLYNLPSDEWIALVPIRETSPGDFVPLGTFVVNTGPPQVPTDPNRPAYPYDACQSRVSLFEVPAEVHIVTQAPPGIDGPLPVAFYALTDAAGTDIYPPGSDDLVLCGLFDTGSTSLAINDGQPNRLPCVGSGTTDAAELQISASTTVDVRLGGLSTRRADGTVPMGPPGTADGAQVEVGSVTAEPAPLDVTLLGGAVLQNVVAYIDNGSLLTDATTGVIGPDIEFFEPGDAAIPAADIVLALDRVGVPERYVLPGLSFEHGGASAQPTGGADPGFFLLDTGTTLTIIGDRVAGELGLIGGAGAFNCYDGTANGFTIDQVVMAGTGGSYRIEGVEVCWAQGAIQSAGIFDAVLGSDVLLDVPFVFDGQNNTLGLVAPPTS